MLNSLSFNVSCGELSICFASSVRRESELRNSGRPLFCEMCNPRSEIASFGIKPWAREWLTYIYNMLLPPFGLLSYSLLT